MSRLSTAINRIKTMSLKRMYMYAKASEKRYGKPTVRVLADMCYCYIKYKTGYLDYLTFGFAVQSAANRATFMTMSDNYRLVEKLNVGEHGREIFRDKIVFNTVFRDYIGREFRDLDSIDAEAFADFVSDREYIFVKAPDGYGGLGVKRVDIGGTEPEQLYSELKKDGFSLAEQAIIQHPDMNRLSPSSINSIRICTLRADGKVHFMYSLVRMSSSDKSVDNISSGGMYCPIHDGVITAPAYCDKTGDYYFSHPVTGTEFVGFKIPYFDESVELAKKAAEVVEGINYIGWDVAVTPDGPVLIEGNTVPGYDMCQNYVHLPDDKQGMLPKFKSIVGNVF